VFGLTIEQIKNMNVKERINKLYKRKNKALVGK